MAKVGRPPTYGPEIFVKAREYIDSCEDTFTKMGKDFIRKVNIPTIEGLATALNVSRAVVYDWERDHPDFLDITEEVRRKQASSLIQNGLSGAYNPTITKVLLSKHGYREGIEQVGSEGKPLIPESQLSKEDKELLQLIKERERNSRTKTE